jgi:ABC-type bacteriocin/lantibiotic exporter with double-glycine peptidase domain
MCYRLSGVWLAYSGSKEYALQDVSLTIPKGSLVAIVGPEACGKTTIARVILGIIKPQARV